MKRRRPQAEDFTVGWISALPVEHTAAVAMLDEEYEGHGDTAQYTLGRIGVHNVVVACLPAGVIGTNSAAVEATKMQHIFPAVRIGLLVGIGGGVPSCEADIRLGDVVISQPQGRYGGVVQYDFGKAGSDGLMRTGFLNAPPPVLLTAVSNLRSNPRAGSNIQVHLSSLARRPEFDRHHAGPDILFRSSYGHLEGPTCDRCSRDMVVARTQRRTEEMVIHCGTIASGNQVIKDGATRDTFSAQLGGILCFEMEAAGLMNSFPCLVVRGICDYADSHKNKKWQPLAAAAAAACAKEILSFVPAHSPSNHLDVESTPRMAGHLEISRFNEPDHVEYGNAADCNQVGEATPKVSSLCARSVLTADQRRTYLDSLKFDQIDARHATIKTAHAKTCRWLLSTSEYQDWLDANKLPDHYGFLWIKGKPATGKSTIMKFAFSNEKKTTTDTIVISFFFNARGEALEKSVLGMYRSLLFQLLEYLPDLQDVFGFLPPTAPIGESCRWETETVKTLFQHAIEKLGRRCLTCFIDALDECEEDQARDMVAFFEQLGQLAVSSHVRFRVCFSSRHYPHITIENGIQLVLEDQEGHDRDIANYLHTELKAGRSKQVEQIKTEILEKASGIFLWIVLVVQILNREYAHGHMHALRKRLNEIPTRLEDLFQEILTRDGQNMEELILCLQWILYARRPLKREELYYAILAGTQPEELTAWSSEDITIQDFERFILSSSKGLVEMTKSKNPTVQFIHESVRDFLKGNGFQQFRSNLGSDFVGLSHERLKQCCQNYLRIDTSDHLPPTLPKASSQDAATLRQLASGMFPFLEYSVQNVLHHADAADGVSQDAFIENFPLAEWITMNNLFERYQIRRYTSQASLLYILAEKDLPNLIRVELDRVQHMDIRGERHGFPLLTALAHTSEKALRALIATDTGTCSNSDIPQNHSYYLTHGDRQEAIGYILKNGPDISSHSDQSLLSWGAERGNITLVKILLGTSKVDISSKSKKGRTPLSWAAERGHDTVVQQLLARSDVEADSKDSHAGRTPLSWVAGEGHEAVVKLLAARGDVEADSKCYLDRTPLSWAAKRGHEAVVRLLLAREDVEANSKDFRGQTPLSLAAEEGHDAVVQQLLARSDVEADSKDFRGQTPLLRAASGGRDAVVQQLLARADIEADSKDENGRTPLSWAAAEGHDAVVQQLLVRSDVEADSKDKYGRTPLLRAASGGRDAVVQQLLARSDIEADSKDKDGRTPLSLAAGGPYWALKRAHEAVVKLLVTQDDVEADSKDKNGRTPLSWAAERGQDAVVQQLLALSDVEVNSKDRDGRTPLSWAASVGHDAVVQQLLARSDVEVNSEDKDGRTPLSWAALRRRKKVVQLLNSHTS